MVLADGSLLVVEIARGTLTRIADGRTEVVAEPGGGPNGAAIGPDGAVYLCNNGGRFRFIERAGLLFPGPRPEEHRGGTIQRVDLASGRGETLYDACRGRKLHAPNDLVFDGRVGFWFTDHGTGSGNDGGLFYASANGSMITCWLDGLRAPNGVGLSTDGATLYYADTQLRQLKAVALAAPGELDENAQRNGGVIVQLPDKM
jgi:gluconolactonase